MTGIDNNHWWLPHLTSTARGDLQAGVEVERLSISQSLPRPSLAATDTIRHQHGESFEGQAAAVTAPALYLGKLSRFYCLRILLPKAISMTSWELYTSVLILFSTESLVRSDFFERLKSLLSSVDSI